MAQNSEDLVAAVDPYIGLDFGLIERGVIDYLRALFPEVFASNERDRVRCGSHWPDGFVAIVLQKKHIRAIPAPWLETKRRLIPFVERYGHLCIVAAPVGGYPVREMLRPFEPSGSV